MAESKHIPPEVPAETLRRLSDLRNRKQAIQVEIDAIMSETYGLAPAMNDCLRCGHSWSPRRRLNEKTDCPRCGSVQWNEPWRQGLRKPSDPPAKSWYKRKSNRKHLKIDVQPEGKEVVHDVSGRFTLPPRIAAMLPPPPPISRPSLSERFDQIRAEQGEPQPEQVSSHAAPTFDDAEDERRANGRGNGDFTKILDVTFDTLRKHEQESVEVTDVSKSEMYSLREEIPSGGVGIKHHLRSGDETTENQSEMPRVSEPEPTPEPEYLENLLTERELEELRASEEDIAWPTTKSED